jgi:hypothetical protein
VGTVDSTIRTSRDAVNGTTWNMYRAATRQVRGRVCRSEIHNTKLTLYVGMYGVGKDKSGQIRNRLISSVPFGSDRCAAIKKKRKGRHGTFLSELEEVYASFKIPELELARTKQAE